MKTSKSGVRSNLQLTGVQEVLLNLGKELRKITRKSEVGLLAAAEIVRKDMDVTPPLIPVDTGALRASWYAYLGTSAGRPNVTMGFSATYALMVHERGWTGGKRPGSGPKFFEASLRRNKDKMLGAIAKTAKL